MKKSISTFLFLVILIFSSTHAGWTAKGKVVQVFSGSGFHFMQTSITSSTGCAQPGKFWWRSTDSNSKEMLAIALSALTNGNQISVNQDNSPNCFNMAQFILEISIFSE